MRFGKLVARELGSRLRRTGRKGALTRWWCDCDCGKRKLILTGNLTNGSTISCGCVGKGGAKRGQRVYGEHKRLYGIWRGMLTRSPVKDPKVLAIYTGVGTHDPAWDDFETFKEWSLANGYKESLTIDRIDNDGGYWPDNCRWATMRQQSRNKTTNKFVRVNGKRMVHVDAAAIHGITTSTLQRRLDAGWPPEEAILRLSKREAEQLFLKYDPQGAIERARAANQARRAA